MYKQYGTKHRRRKKGQAKGQGRLYQPKSVTGTFVIDSTGWNAK